ncbi:AAA family ATPase [Sphingomonas sp.]|uniref:AAA family ATPase n=1 Tax=Sphingomonas sp. TaxID=28214 RepID=UPI00307E9175
MNDPANIPLNFEDMREWLLDYRRDNGLSWPALGRIMGIPHGSISAIGAPSWAGNKQKMAERIYAFKQKVASQEARAKVALTRPDFIETKTALSLIFLMEWAQGGRITVGALGPGCGKTMSAEHYKASIGGTVWYAAMRQSSRSVTAMINQVMPALGLNHHSTWSAQRSTQIESFVRGKQGLLIIDEANNLDWAALEELRSWHDNAGLGICLLGNEELVERIRGGARSHAYARLNSRIALCHVQDLPLEEDAEAYLDAMQIDDGPMRRLLKDVALSPGHGGLRELYQILETANMLAIMAERPLELDHVRQAISSRTTKVLRRAA